jgi:CHAD domain-containing protein
MQVATLRSAINEIADGGSEDQLHRVRIEAKHLRNTAAIMADFLNPGVSSAVESLTLIQDDLGTRRDLQRAIDTLSTLTDTGVPRGSPEAQLIDEMTADLISQRDSCSTEWRHHWSAAQEGLSALFIAIRHE